MISQRSRSVCARFDLTQSRVRAARLRLTMTMETFGRTWFDNPLGPAFEQAAERPQRGGHAPAGRIEKRGMLLLQLSGARAAMSQLIVEPLNFSAHVSGVTARLVEFAAPA